jgi:hypothetical protein
LRRENPCLLAIGNVGIGQVGTLTHQDGRPGACHEVLTAGPRDSDVGRMSGFHRRLDVVVLMGRDAGLDHPLAGDHPEIQTMSGFGRKLSQEHALRSAVAFTERVDCVESGKYAGGARRKFRSRASG